MARAWCSSSMRTGGGGGISSTFFAGVRVRFGSYISRSSGQRWAPPPQLAWWQPAKMAPFANWIANAPSLWADENGHSSRT